MGPVISSQSNRGLCWSGKWTHVVSEWENKRGHVPINAQKPGGAAGLALLRGDVTLTAGARSSLIPRGQRALGCCAGCFPPPNQTFQWFIPARLRMACYSFPSSAGSEGDKQSLIILVLLFSVVLVSLKTLSHAELRVLGQYVQAKTTFWKSLPAKGFFLCSQCGM